MKQFSKYLSLKIEFFLITLLAIIYHATTLDFANAFISPGVNSRAKLVRTALRAVGSGTITNICTTSFPGSLLLSSGRVPGCGWSRVSRVELQFKQIGSDFIIQLYIDLPKKARLPLVQRGILNLQEYISRPNSVAVIYLVLKSILILK